MFKGTNAHGTKKIWAPKSQIVPIANILGRKRLGFKLVLRQWMLMTYAGERSMFLDLKPVEGGVVSFGGMSKGKITSIGKISIPSLASIGNVLYVEGLKYNLLSISQFCNSGYIVSLNNNQCIVKTKRCQVLLYFKMTQ